MTVLGGICVLGISAGALLSSRMRRRAQLIASLSACSATAAGMALCTTFAVDAWLPFVCLVVFTLAYPCGLGPLPWIIAGEVLPS